MKQRWIRSVFVGLLAGSVAVAGCTSSKDGRGNPILTGDSGNGGEDGTGGGGDDTILGDSIGGADGLVGPSGQIATIQKAEAFVNCDETAAAANSGFSDFSLPADLTGVVVTAPQFDLYTHKTDPAKSLDGYFIGEAGGGAWSGILIAVPRSLTVELAVGDVIDISGEATDYFCTTQLKATAVKKTGTASLPPASPVQAAELADATDGEQWEGVLVRVVDGKVTAAKNNFGEFTLDGALAVDDMYGHTYDPAVGETVTATGVMHYTFSVRKLEPRSDADILPGGGTGGDDVTGGGDSTTPSGDSIVAIQSAAQSTTCGTPDGIQNIDPNIALEGVVVASPMFKVSDTLDGYFVSDGVGGPHSGMQMVVPKELGIALQRGDVLDVTGEWVEYYCMTQLSAETITKTGTSAAPAADVVLADDIATGGQDAEAYEGVYVQVDNVSVSQEPDQYGQWKVDDVLLVDDVFDYTYNPTQGATITHLRGILTYSFAENKLLPTSTNDIDVDGTGPGPDVIIGDGGPVGTGEIAEIQQASASVDCSGDGKQTILDVSLEGVIVSSPKLKVGNGDGWYVTDAAGGPYSGILISIPTTEGATLQQGDVIDLSGTWIEYYCMTQIEVSSHSKVSQGASLPAPSVVTAGELLSGGEAWEGVVVTIEDSTVTSAADQYGVYKVSDGTGEVQGDDDFKPGYTAAQGDAIASLTGLVRWNFGAFNVNPRSQSDIVLGSGPIDDTGTGTPDAATSDTGSGPAGTSVAAIQTSAASMTCSTPGNVSAGPVTLEGVTVVSPKGYGGSNLDAYIVMDPPNGPNAGVLIIVKTSLGVTLQPGDVVDVSGDHKEYYCLTEVFADSVTVVTSGSSTLTPISVTTTQLAAGAEQYEGSLVTVTNVTASAVNDQYGDFPIDNGVLVDNTFYKHTAESGQKLTSVTGFLTYGFSAWRIMPRSAADVIVTP